MPIQDQISALVKLMLVSLMVNISLLSFIMMLLIKADGRTEVCGKVERPLIWRGAESLPGGPTPFVRGKVFDSRENAIDYANAVIKARKEAMIVKMNDPRYRALRAQYGLPSYI